MNKSICLNIFTNCGSFAPNCDLIMNTYNSFVNTFGIEYSRDNPLFEIKIWCDSHPNVKLYKAYESNLKDLFKSVTLTESLPRGYHQCVSENTHDYSFMLEHDWNFVSENLPNGIDLQKIMLDMDYIKAFHLRFNQFGNFNRRREWLTEVSGVNYKYCTSQEHSNNPHIIDVKYYKEHYLNKISFRTGGSGRWRYGVENRSDMSLERKPYIFGELKLPATIKHLDGRSWVRLESTSNGSV